jgi:hypothetical protein
MAERKKEDSFREWVFGLSKNVLGRNNIIALSEWIVKFAGDIETGIFLSQLLYWCDKGSRSDRFIYKSRREWAEETFLSEYHVERAAKNLVKRGLLEIKKWQANGAPTYHYRLTKEFDDAYYKFLEIEKEKLQDRSAKKGVSITETTTETTPETTEKHNGAKSDDVHATSFSFDEYVERYEVDEDTVEGISYYLKQYRRFMGKEHPRLKEHQWSSVVSDLFYCSDLTIDRGWDIYIDQLERIIDHHFRTRYTDCDYNILHFNSPHIKALRGYEVGAA